MQAKQPGILLNAAIESSLVRTVAETLESGTVALHAGGGAVDEDGYCYAHTVMSAAAADFIANPGLQREHFGPVTLFVLCDSLDQMADTINSLEGQLTATLQAEVDEIELTRPLAQALQKRVGRLIWNGVPTGVEVNYAMQHGGPYPATTAAGSTSVGMTAIRRFMRPLAYQDLPGALLPAALQDANPLGILRLVNGEFTREGIG